MSKSLLFMAVCLATACAKETPKPASDVDGIMAQAADKAVEDATAEAIIAMSKDTTAAAALPDTKTND